MAFSVVAGRLRPFAIAIFRKPGKLSLHTTSRKAGEPLYREKMFEYKEPRYIHHTGTAFSAFLWYWILYHCYFEFEHLVPSHKYPDPSKYTDEELGIPPDDE